MAKKRERPQFVGSIGQQGGYTQQNVTYHEAATPTVNFKKVGHGSGTLISELTLDPPAAVQALTVYTEDPKVTDVDLRTASGTMTDYMRGRAGNRPFVSVSRPTFPVFLTLTTDNTELRAGMVAYNFQPVSLG